MARICSGVLRRTVSWEENGRELPGIRAALDLSYRAKVSLLESASLCEPLLLKVKNWKTFDNLLLGMDLIRLNVCHPGSTDHWKIV